MLSLVSYTKEDKSMFNDLDYKGIEFTVPKKDFDKIEKKNNDYINVFCHKNNLVYPVYVSNEKFEYCMDLLMITDENKLHYLCIKDFNRFMCNKTKNKNKNSFFKYCLQYFSNERFLVQD